MANFHTFLTLIENDCYVKALSLTLVANLCMSLHDMDLSRILCGSLFIASSPGTPHLRYADELIVCQTNWSITTINTVISHFNISIISNPNQSQANSLTS